MNKLPVRLLLLPPVIAAGVVGIGASIIALGYSIKTGDPLYIVLIIGGTGVILGFLWGSIVWSERLAHIYQPRVYESADSLKKPDPVKIEVARGSGSYLSVDILELPCGIEMEQLIKTGKLLTQNNFSFTHTISGNGQPLSRQQFESLRDLLIARGLAKWRSEKSRQLGCELTHPGKSLFKQLATYQEGTLPRLVKSLA